MHAGVPRYKGNFPGGRSSRTEHMWDTLYPPELQEYHFGDQCRVLSGLQLIQALLSHRPGNPRALKGGVGCDSMSILTACTENKEIRACSEANNSNTVQRTQEQSLSNRQVIPLAPVTPKVCKW